MDYNRYKWRTKWLDCNIDIIMADFNSKYTGEQVEDLLDQVASGNAGGGGGGISAETDPVFSASPAATITEDKIDGWDSKYSKPSGGIPKSDLASDVQTSLGNADTALQSYTEQYKGTVTGIKVNGSTKSPSSGVVDLGTVITSHQDISGKQDKLVSGTNIKTINGESILGSGNITISGGSGSGGGSGSYVPMPETFIEQGATLEHTLSPNTSLYAYLVGSGSVKIYLQEPTSFDVVNEYTIIFRTFGFGNAITINKTIIWANGKSPVLSDSNNEIIEISVKCINAPMYDGIQYLGTWAKYETISTDPT